MPRTARKISTLGVYHVMMRGINHQQIFDDNLDYAAFINLLRRIHRNSKIDNNENPYPWDIYAYALMGNHFHLLVKVRNYSIGDVVKQLASSYVFHFNHRHGRDGHLFRERFKSEPCDSIDYLKTLLRYVHQNPVVAGLCSNVGDYEYTSWPEYLGKIPKDMGICNVNEVLKFIDFAELKQLVETDIDTETNCLDYSETNGRHISDIEITSILQTKYNIFHPTQLQSLPSAERNSIIRELKMSNAGVRQLQRLTGLGISTISRIK